MFPPLERRELCSEVVVLSELKVRRERPPAAHPCSGCILIPILSLSTLGLFEYGSGGSATQYDERRRRRRDEHPDDRDSPCHRVLPPNDSVRRYPVMNLGSDAPSSNNSVLVDPLAHLKLQCFSDPSTTRRQGRCVFPAE